MPLLCLQGVVCYTCWRGWRGMRRAARFAPPLSPPGKRAGFCDPEGTKSLSVFRERRQVYKPSSLVLRPPQGWDKVSHSNGPFPFPKSEGAASTFGLARLDYRKAKPGGAVKVGAKSTIHFNLDCLGWVCYICFLFWGS